jgi:hypothetical protein
MGDQMLKTFNDQMLKSVEDFVPGGGETIAEPARGCACDSPTNPAVTSDRGPPLAAAARVSSPEVATRI